LKHSQHQMSLLTNNSSGLHHFHDFIEIRHVFHVLSEHLSSSLKVRPAFYE
jgi:hypothetical protein